MRPVSSKKAKTAIRSVSSEKTCKTTASELKSQVHKQNPQYALLSFAIIGLVAAGLIISLVNYSGFKPKDVYGGAVSSGGAGEFESSVGQSDSFSQKGLPGYKGMGPLRILSMEKGYGNFIQTQVDDKLYVYDVDKAMELFEAGFSEDDVRQLAGREVSPDAGQPAVISGEDSFIVQFKEKPVLAKEAELKKSVTDFRSKGVHIDEARFIADELAKHRTVVSQLHARAEEDIRMISGERARRKFVNVFNGFEVKISSNDLDKVRKLDYVKGVYPNPRVEAVLYDSVPLINADDVWGLGYDGEGTTISIIDTGIDYTNTDLGGCFGAGCKVVGGYDFVNNDNDPMDDQGHGTHCAGIAASDGSLKGVAPGAKLLAYKVLDSSGSGYMSDVIAGIERSVDPNQDSDYSDHADVISMSLGGQGSPDDPASQAVDTAVGRGVVVVVAAGNGGPGYQTVGSPGVARKALTVGAACKPDQVGVHRYCNSPMASFSSRGPTSEEGIKPEVAAPGVGICSLQWDSAWDDNKCFDDEHVAISGTSMATPHVAGVAALLVQAHPDWSPEEVKSAVVGTASDLGENVYIQGSGLVDAFKAVNAPVLLDPGVANVKSTTFSFSVKNVESSSLGIEFVAEPVEHVETGTDYPDFIQSFSNNNFCLPAAGSEKVYFQTMSLDTLPGGKYSGFVRVKAYPNCDFSSEPEETVLPVGFLKAKKLTIDLTMSSVSYDDHHIVGIFLRNKENGYYWDEDIFSYDEHLVETINAAEDVFDAYIFVHTSNQGGTRVRDSVIIRGVDLTGVYSKSLVINEVLAPAVETNIRDILNSRGMAPTMIQYVFRTKNNGISVSWGMPDYSINTVLASEEHNLAVDVKDALFDDYELLYYINAKKQGVAAEFSDIISLPLYFSYPFNDLSGNILPSELKETELVLKSPIIADWVGSPFLPPCTLIPDPKKGSVAGSASTMVPTSTSTCQPPFYQPFSPTTKTFTYREDYSYIIWLTLEDWYFGEYNEFLWNENQIFPEETKFFEKPFSFELSSSLAGGFEYPEFLSGRFIDGFWSTQGVSNYIIPLPGFKSLAEGSLVVRYPDGSVMFTDSFGGAWAIDCNDEFCPLGDYWVDWVANEFFTGEYLETHMIAHYNGEKWTVRSPDACTADNAGEIRNDGDDDFICDDEAWNYCDSSHSSSIRDIAGGFDALCLGAVQGNWFECDADGVQERIGGHGVTVPLGTVKSQGGHEFVCDDLSLEGVEYERWHECCGNGNCLSGFIGCGSVVSVSYDVPRMSRFTVRPKKFIPNAVFSAKVSSGLPVVAERSTYWGNLDGGHVTIGATEPAINWYFGEGYTVGDFYTYVLVQNPNDVSAVVTVEYLLAPEFVPESGETVARKTKVVPPRSRETFRPDSLDAKEVPDEGPAVDNAQFSIKVSSSVPVVAERSMYWNGLGGGHVTVGATEPSNLWYFVDGYTTATQDAAGNPIKDAFYTYVLIQNPNDEPAQVTATFRLTDGSEVTAHKTVPARSRENFRPNSEIPGALTVTKQFSTMVESDIPIVAERSMYWKNLADGHVTIGTPKLSDKWYFADGYTKDGFVTYILVQNPNDEPAQVSVKYVIAPEFGGGVAIENKVVPARSRETFRPNNVIPNVQFSEEVTSSLPIAAERSTYWNIGAGQGGHATVGAAEPSNSWYFADGYSVGDHYPYILLYNPNNDATQVRIDFMLAGDPGGCRHKTGAVVNVGGVDYVCSSDGSWSQG